MKLKKTFSIGSALLGLCLGIYAIVSFHNLSLPATGVYQIISLPNNHGLQIGSGSRVHAVTEVRATGKFAFPVVQSGNNTPTGNVIGQYAYAANRGSIGLLAHNFAAGASFYTLAGGDEVIITFSNGKTKRFVVNNVLRFQATDPNDFSKPFIASNGKEFTAKQVFNQAYKSNWVTFQTCIQNAGSPTWGLLFVQAAPKN